MLFFLTLSLMCFPITFAFDQTELGQGKHNVTVKSYWLQTFQQRLSSFEDVLLSVNLSEKCQGKLDFYLKGLKNGDEWAFEILDSMEKIPSGSLRGNTMFWPGKFDECMEVSSFATQYCIVSVQVIEENSANKVLKILKRIFQNPVNIGTCLPSGCSNSEVAVIVKKLSDLSLNNTKVNVEFCQTAEPKKFDSSAIAIITILLFFVSILLASTVYDGYNKFRSKEAKPAFSSFSIIQNGSALFATNQSGGIGSLHGLRFLSMVWIILLHTYSSSLGYSWNNILNVIQLKKVLLGEIILNANVAVDTFYCMSGLLVTYVFMKKIKLTKTFKVLHFYIHRYFRLTPVYAIIIGIAAGLFPYFGSGPRWPEIEDQSSYCKQNWWLSLLYVSNIFNLSSMCQPHCWFLASDMQMYIISPLILYPLYKCPRLGWLTAIVVILISSVSDFIVTYILDLPPSSIIFYKQDLDKVITYSQVIYMQAYTRLGPYVIGILTGYILSTKSADDNWLNKKRASIGWMLATICNLSVLFGLYRYVSSGSSPSLIERCLYSSLSRPAWAAGIAYIVLACAWGYGGIINCILSWKGFLPLGRLTYCAYIVHYNVLLIFYASRQSTLYYDIWIIMFIFLGVLITSYTLAIPLTLVFEMPLLKLEKIILETKSDKILTKKCKQYDSTRDDSIESIKETQNGVSNAAFEEEQNYGLK